MVSSPASGLPLQNVPSPSKAQPPRPRPKRHSGSRATTRAVNTSHTHMSGTIGSDCCFSTRRLRSSPGTCLPLRKEISSPLTVLRQPLSPNVTSTGLLCSITKMIPDVIVGNWHLDCLPYTVVLGCCPYTVVPGCCARLLGTVAEYSWRRNLGAWHDQRKLWA